MRSCGDCAANRKLRLEREVLRKTARLFRQGDDPVSRFRFVSDHQSAYGGKRLCRVVGASRSGYYALSFDH